MKRLVKQLLTRNTGKLFIRRVIMLLFYIAGDFNYYSSYSF